MQQSDLEKTHADLAPDVHALIGMPINDDEDRAFLARSLQEFKTMAASIDAKKKEATRPMNDALKAVRGWFRPIEDLLARVDTEGKQKLLAYDRQRRIQQEADLARAVATQDRTALISATLPEPKIQGVSKRKVWRIRILDKKAIPLEFLVVDEQALLAFARAGSTAPSGVEFYQEETLAVGGL